MTSINNSGGFQGSYGGADFNSSSTFGNSGQINSVGGFGLGSLVSPRPNNNSMQMLNEQHANGANGFTNNSF
jgi:hypothetical protein